MAAPWKFTPFHVFLVFATFVCSTLANHDAKRLYDDLIRKNKYNKLIRPVGNSTQKLMIKMGIKLTQIIDVDERNEILSLNMWVIHEWEDYALRWNPVEYGGVSMLYVPAESIWIPDIVLYNNADGDYTITMLQTKARISWYGTVRWEPPAIFLSYCNIDVEYFPFDQQLCLLKFGSWTYDGDQVDLKHIWHEKFGLLEQTANVDPAMDLSEYYRSVEWDILRVAARKNIIFYPCCEEPYPDVTFNITIRRKTLFYTIHLIFPCVSMTFLTILVCYLPCDCGEKISLCISLLLSLSLFQLLLLELIPPTSITTPLIGKYIMFTTIIVSLSVLTSVVVLNIHFRSPATHKLPVKVRLIFLEILPQFLMMQRPKHIDDDPVDDEDFSWQHSDLANYDNPYKGGKNQFRRINTDDSSSDEFYSRMNCTSTFVGANSINMAAFCQACSSRRLARFPVNVQRAFDSVMFLARHTQEAADVQIKEDWKYVALVVDRLLLWVFVIVTLVSTVTILFNAPSLYDNRKALYDS